LRAPRDVKDHVPQDPIELPVPTQTWGGAVAHPPSPSPSPAGATPARVEK
jgi:hypothetical protein